MTADRCSSWWVRPPFTLSPRSRWQRTKFAAIVFALVSTPPRAESRGPLGTPTSGQFSRWGPAQRPAGPRRRRPQPSGWFPSRRVPLKAGWRATAERWLVLPADRPTWVGETGADNQLPQDVPDRIGARPPAGGGRTGQPQPSRIARISVSTPTGADGAQPWERRPSRRHPRTAPTADGELPETPEGSCRRATWPGPLRSRPARAAGR